ncbi:MAG: tRNA (adenosine(37)-N6)-dimethylallyltransferase MiaA [Candidatus Borkfalkiaceae bacterium]|nr:tRNA (adenosine(37)-N6)-dimethylallyltransferase MiaA [Christensenellaceae bacterium]
MVQENRLNSEKNRKIIVVCGPTASGKTALAVEIALKFGGEIVSADSVSVYKGLDIGSAKPSEEEKKGVPHYLIDVASPKDSFSVGDYEELAVPTVEDILDRGKIPIICGGTGFYVNSILYRMSYGLSKGDAAIRQKYEQAADEKGREYVYSVLKEKDPETAGKLHPNDLVRVIRALEIFDATGVKKSDIKDEMIPRYDFIALMPTMPREALYERINSRVDNMMSCGLTSEVKGLIESGVTPDDQCMQGIGYKETAEAILSGTKVATELIKMNTRRYAKRQITFFKRFQNLYPIDFTSDDKIEKTFKIVNEFLNF